jgi:uncharacterized protein involved in copper resistance
MSDPVAEAAAQLAEQEPEAVQEVQSQGETVAEPATVAPADISAMTSAPAAESDATQVEGESPNAAPAAVESTTGPASAPSAVGDGTTYTTAASSVEPLHVRVATHLEAIFQMTKEHVEAAPNEATAHALSVKAHIGDALHRISNGMAVAEGELVQKLEALYRML